MMNQSSNHNREKTHTVAVREEVDRALGSSVPAAKRDEVIDRVEQIVERYSSPFPDAVWLEQVERLSPGATKEIIASSIDELKGRRILEEKQQNVSIKEIELIDSIAKGEQRSTREGRDIGFLAYITCFIFAAVMYRLGSEPLAYAGFGAGSIGIVGQLIRGGRSTPVSITAEKVNKPDSKQLTKAGSR